MQVREEGDDLDQGAGGGGGGEKWLFSGCSL